MRHYWNPRAGLEGLPKLLARATSASRPRERPAARQAQVRLDAHQANKLAMAYGDGNAVKDLAELFGIHRTTVTAVLQPARASSASTDSRKAGFDATHLVQSAAAAGPLPDDHPAAALWWRILDQLSAQTPQDLATPNAAPATRQRTMPSLDRQRHSTRSVPPPVFGPSR